jgi:serine/threonine protein kinase
MLCTVLYFCAHGSLFSKIHQKDGPSFPYQFKLSLLKDVCRGMAYLHQSGIVHRDLKSPNILITDRNVAVIADFGLSKDAVGTMTMSAIGTPHWMAPEILQGERYSNSADVWAFGVIIFEVIAQKLPYMGISPIVLMQKVANDEIRLRIEEPEEMKTIMNSCFRPAHERPTFDELLVELEKL